MQQLDIFSVDQPVTNGNATGFKYRRRLYNKKDQYLYTVIPTEDGYTLNRVQSLAENIGILHVNNEEYQEFVKERSLIEKIPKDVKERMRCLTTSTRSNQTYTS